jgi:hypothetical protein
MHRGPTTEKISAIARWVKKNIKSATAVLKMAPQFVGDRKIYTTEFTNKAYHLFYLKE